VATKARSARTLETHAVILAEWAGCETVNDDDSRRMPHTPAGCVQRAERNSRLVRSGQAGETN
jgi:hypothetical protein